MDNEHNLTTDRFFLREIQYADARRLASRQSIWAYKEPRTELFGWALDLVPRSGDELVVDVGAGNGLYSQALRARGHEGPIISVDLSLGMMRSMIEAGSGSSPLVADAAELPLGAACSELTLAMHMLYHLPDRGAGLAELRRVTRPGAPVLVVTNGRRHLRAFDLLLVDAVHEVTGEWVEPVGATLPFAVEDAPAELGEVFDEVVQHDFLAELAVPEAAPVVAYLASHSRAGGVVGHGDAWEAIVETVRRRAVEELTQFGALRAKAVTACFVCR